MKFSIDAENKAQKSRNQLNEGNFIARLLQKTGLTEKESAYVSYFVIGLMLFWFVFQILTFNQAESIDAKYYYDPALQTENN